MRINPHTVLSVPAPSSRLSLCGGERGREREREKKDIIQMMVHHLPPSVRINNLRGDDATNRPRNTPIGWRGKRPPSPATPLWLGSQYNRRSPGPFVQTPANPYILIYANFGEFLFRKLSILDGIVNVLSTPDSLVYRKNGKKKIM